MARNSIMYICNGWVQRKLGVRLGDIPSICNNDFARVSESTTRAAIQISLSTWAKLQYSPWLSTFCSPWWHLVKSSTSPSVQIKEFTSMVFRHIFLGLLSRYLYLHSFQTTAESNDTIAIATLGDWLKDLAPVLQPTRSKTNRTLYARFFPSFGQATGNCYEFLLVHRAVCSCCDWSK